MIVKSRTDWKKGIVIVWKWKGIKEGEWENWLKIIKMHLKDRLKNSIRRGSWRIIWKDMKGRRVRILRGKGRVSLHHHSLGRGNKTYTWFLNRWIIKEGKIMVHLIEVRADSSIQTNRCNTIIAKDILHQAKILKVIPLPSTPTPTSNNQ